MKIVRQILLMLFIFTSSCFASPPHVKAIYKVMKLYCNEMAILYPYVQAIGNGGAMMTDVKEAFLHFFVYEKMSIDEARILYINMVERFLQIANHNEKLRPYMHEYPFTPKNFNLILTFVDKTNRMFEDGVSLLFYIPKTNCLHYRIFSFDNEKFTSLLKEDYLVALETVRNDNALSLPPIEVVAEKKQKKQGKKDLSLNKSR